MRLCVPIGCALLMLAPWARSQIVFGPAGTTTLAGNAAPDFAAADLDGDGFDDLVIGNAGAPGLRLGDGAGHFGAETPLATDAAGGTVALADMNGDEMLDLVVGSSQTSQLSVALADGKGGYEPAFGYGLGNPTLVNALTLDVRDGDGDGDTDVLAVTPAPQFGSALGEARLFRNLGDGHLGVIAVLPTWTVGSKISRGLLGDLNDDGRPDLVLLYDAGQVAPMKTFAYLCQPDATFEPCWQQTGVAPERLADLDGDGDLDLLLGPGPSMTMLNPGDGSFAPGPVVPAMDIEAIVNEPTDLDGDGVLDLVVTGHVPPELWVLHGVGDGSFLAPSARVSLYPVSYGAGAGEVGDFDGDGRPDVVVGISPMAVPASLSCSLNRTYAAGGPLLDLGHQLKGASWPIQLAQGSFTTGQPFAFTLSGAPASGSAYFIAGTSQLDAPFKGGTIVPLPVLITGPWSASPSGAVSIAGLWPAVPSGLGLVLQFWIPDAAGPVGFAASSGVQLTLP